ncbi:hypothetical protein GQ44DRAFT_753405, partial [Phaeosphaeriaceae sp. PMI808]
MFIDDLANWVRETPTKLPFTDLYETDTGRHPNGIEFKARPVMGGMFALLLLDAEGYVAPRRLLDGNGKGNGSEDGGGSQGKKDDKKEVKDEKKKGDAIRLGTGGNWLTSAFLLGLSV